MGASFGILPPPIIWVKEIGFFMLTGQETSHILLSRGIILPRAAIGGFILPDIIL
jgi:hypothetical protein